MSPHTYLSAASELLLHPPSSMRRCWQRGSACLTRLALEQGLRHYWDQVAPSVVDRPMRNQLLVLPTFAGAEAASTARTAWHGLSRAMHHHTYELAPTVAELRGWHQDVAALLPQLELADPAGPKGSRPDAPAIQ
ncbi:hypothetical protein [Micromonospora lupini]|uniref:Uncharacterized protein n=1 Tax=Micromonospora lupini str. Lupac 08 TaxID=1150864 RepID=I0L1W1_9ACTN|nr:hypothetical protein [Micromonospora lupini]CCH17808.1 conserved hypothetical protein [Micromonospora lupini str. Lupac 08]